MRLELQGCCTDQRRPCISESCHFLWIETMAGTRIATLANWECAASEVGCCSGPSAGFPVTSGRGGLFVLPRTGQTVSGKTSISKSQEWVQNSGRIAEVRCVGGASKVKQSTRYQQETKRQSIFDVEYPRTSEPPTQAWDLLRQDVLYLDWRARQDVLAIKAAHDKVVEVLNPLARELKSVGALREQLASLQEELGRAHEQVHLSEARVEHTLQKLARMEAALNDKLPQSNVQNCPPSRTRATVQEALPQAVEDSQAAPVRKKGLNTSGPLAPYSAWLRNYWYPVAFSATLNENTMIPIESFEEPWVLFRGKDGKAGCVRDECAHRACPLSLGTVKDGRIQCPYHGWEYSTGGKCEKMPSTKFVSTSIRSLPCVEQDGMVWIWPGEGTPEVTLPSLNPPEGYVIHAEIVLELPVEHGLLVENLLDLAHAPFTHTTTFAKGWSVPSSVNFKTPVDALRGYWDPYPIDMAFQPPCMVLSTIGLAKPGQLDGSSTAECAKHLHQLHVCMPSTRGKTRLLYRMALDFAGWAKHVPYIHRLWEHLANQVLAEDLRLVEGQQDRMHRGANVWNRPVAYDKLGVRYRRWRNAVESGDSRLPFGSSDAHTEGREAHP